MSLRGTCDFFQLYGSEKRNIQIDAALGCFLIPLAGGSERQKDKGIWMTDQQKD